MKELREACAAVAARARHVHVLESRIAGYAAALPLSAGAGSAGSAGSAGPDPDAHLRSGSREDLLAFWITLDAINFGSGWFPTLSKRAGRSGYFTIAGGLRERFVTHGRWSAEELSEIDAAEIAMVLGQDPDHKLMRLFAASLRDLGRRLGDEYAGSFEALVDAAGPSAVTLARRLGGWECFADVSHYDGLVIPFLKRAQIAAADLARAGLAAFDDLDQLTMFADNLVPHVLRLDGVLEFEPALVARIERGELLDHGSPEEVEVRACALHAVELIVGARPGTAAWQVDELLWRRGQGPSYKAVPRHRARCTAY